MIDFIRFLGFAFVMSNIFCPRWAFAGELCNPALPINTQSFDPTNLQCYQLESVQDGTFYSILLPVAVDTTVTPSHYQKGIGDPVLVDRQAVSPANGGFWTGASSVTSVDGIRSNSVRDSSGNIYASHNSIN